MPLINTNFDISHSSNEQVMIDVIPKREYKLPPYSSFGRPGFSKDKIEGFNVALTLANLSSAATWLFWNLEHRRDFRTNICKLETSSLTQAEKQKLNRGYKELQEKKLVIRLYKQHYLINPKVILPDLKAYQSIQDDWNRANNITA